MYNPRKFSLLFVGAIVLITLISNPVLVLGYSINPNTQEAIVVADNIISWQTNTGGWIKNTDFTQVTWQPGMSKGPDRNGIEFGTFDNNASIDEMRFLAKVYQATGEDRFKDSFMRGFEWMLEAQYPSGGWPQYYPLRNSYWDNVTFNDQTMTRILEFLQEMIDLKSRYSFLEDEQRARIETAYNKGIDYILKSQIEVNGHLTAWCQQHDPVTYAPLMGRTFEPIATVSYESVLVVQFLMSLRDPSEEVRTAILSAIDWFYLSQLPDGRWARYYDIESNVPVFSGRDSIIRYRVEDVPDDGGSGYTWFNTAPNSLFLILNHKKGYLDDLRSSLPNYKPLTIDVFNDPAIPLVYNPKVTPVETVRGEFEIDIKIKMRNPENFELVTLKIDKEEVYRGTQLEITTAIDTLTLNNGIRHLVIETLTKSGTKMSNVVQFIIDNPETRW